MARFRLCLHVQVLRPGLVILAAKRTGCEVPYEHSSQQLSLDAALLGRPLSLPGLRQWELAARQGRGRLRCSGHSLAQCGAACQAGMPPPWRGKWAQGEVRRPFTLPSQTQRRHLKKSKSTTLMSTDNARDLGVPGDPCHQSTAQKSSSVFTSKLSLFALDVVIFLVTVL